MFCTLKITQWYRNEGGPLSVFTTSGIPNSEKTLSTFGITVFADVDFTVSTTWYLEQSSVIIKRYSLFGSSAKSMLTSDHGAFGSGDIDSGSRLDSGVETKHAQHDWTFFSTILSMPGNHTFSRKSDLFSRRLDDLRALGLLHALELAGHGILVREDDLGTYDCGQLIFYFLPGSKNCYIYT